MKSIFFSSNILSLFLSHLQSLFFFKLLFGLRWCTYFSFFFFFKNTKIQILATNPIKKQLNLEKEICQIAKSKPCLTKSKHIVHNFFFLKSYHVICQISVPKFVKYLAVNNLEISSSWTYSPFNEPKTYDSFSVTSISVLT